MNILYCGDSNMRDGLLISVLSLLDHSSRPVNVYVLTASLTTPGHVWKPIDSRDISYIDSLIKDSACGGSAKLIDISVQFNTQLPYANMDTRFSPYCMLRLYADLIETPDRMLYLDTDVVCRKDPGELYAADISNVQIAGVPDHYGRLMPTAGFTIPGDYLNSGVLLLNMPEIRSTGLFAGCRELCAEKRMFLCDQTAINRLARSRAVLPRRYNEQLKTRPDTVLRHFTTTLHLLPKPHTLTVKPWDVDRLHSVLSEHEFDPLIRKYQYHIKRMNPEL